jgi:hypothetical protein
MSAARSVPPCSGSSSLTVDEWVGSPLPRTTGNLDRLGSVSEWPKVHASKACVGL